MPEPEQVYFDACVMLAFVKGEGDRVKAIRPLLEAAQVGDIEILTSMISIVEVSSGVKQLQGPRSPQIEHAIDALWSPGGPVELVEVYRYIAEDARDLSRQAVDEQRKLRPMDAIHLATAKRMQVKKLYTYDPDLLRWGPAIGVMVERPEIPTHPEGTFWSGEPLATSPEVGSPSADN